RPRFQGTRTAEWLYRIHPDGAAPRGQGGGLTAATTCRSIQRNVRIIRPLNAISTEWEMAMDWNRIEGNWKQFKGAAKEKWGKLTDDDLNVIEGRREQLEGKLQQRYGFARDQIHKVLDDWFKALKYLRAHVAETPPRCRGFFLERRDVAACAT